MSDEQSEYDRIVESLKPQPLEEVEYQTVTYVGGFRNGQTERRTKVPLALRVLLEDHFAVNGTLVVDNDVRDDMPFDEMYIDKGRRPRIQRYELSDDGKYHFKGEQRLFH